MIMSGKYLLLLCFYAPLPEKTESVNGACIFARSVTSSKAEVAAP